MADTQKAAPFIVQGGDSDQDRPEESVRLQKLDHLRTRADFQRLTRVGRKHATRGLVLQVARQPDDQTDHNTPRVGFTASKKVGNAVARNRAKRRLRALAHTVLRSQAQPALDYVLVGRHTTLTRPWPKLINDLETALARTCLDDKQP